MTDFTFKYFAPYTSANQTVAATDIYEARAKHAAWLKQQGYCISGRDEKGVFVGKKRVG